MTSTMPDKSSPLYDYTQSYAHLITERHAMLKPRTHHPYQLGASLYMPATRQDIGQVIKREKLATINSIIICLEDAVSHRDVELALETLQTLLHRWATHVDSIHNPTRPSETQPQQPTNNGRRSRPHPGGPYNMRRPPSCSCRYIHCFSQQPREA